MNIKLISIFLLTIVSFWTVSVISDIYSVTRLEKKPMTSVGKLKDISILSDSFWSGKEVRITLEDGTIYLARGGFGLYKPGDEVSVPADKDSKFFCMRETCLPLE